MERTPQNAVLGAVDELHGVLSLADALLMAGRELDLAGLEGEVAALCAAVAALPADQARAARPALAGLLSVVEGLRGRLLRPLPRPVSGALPGPLPRPGA